MLQKRVIVSLLIALFTALQACAPPRPPEPVILYPGLPEQPRVAYRGSLWGEDNFKEPTFIDRLFGAPKGKSVDKPYGVAVHGSKIYVTMSSPANPGLALLDLEKKEFETLRALGKVGLVLPTGIAVTKDGTLYVSDSGEGMKHVVRFDPSSKASAVVGVGAEFKNPAGIAVNDSLERVYVADSYGHCVKVFSYSGEKLFQFGAIGKKDGELYYPTNLAVDRATGNVAVVDTQNFRVQIFDKDGAFLRKFGEVGDRGGSFSRPKGIGIDSESHLYVADAAFSNVQVFDDQGQLLLFFSGFGRESGKLMLPAGMYIDDQDRIYVADSLNNRIVTFQYFSEKWIKANPDEYARLTGPDAKK